MGRIYVRQSDRLRPRRPILLGFLQHLHRNLHTFILLKNKRNNIEYLENQSGDLKSSVGNALPVQGYANSGIGPFGQGRSSTAPDRCQTTANHDRTGPITTDLDSNKTPISRGCCCIVIDGDGPGTHSSMQARTVPPASTSSAQCSARSIEAETPPTSFMTSRPLKSAPAMAPSSSSASTKRATTPSWITPSHAHTRVRSASSTPCPDCRQGIR